MATANLLSAGLELEDRTEPIVDSADPSLFVPIKLLRKQNKKTDTNMGVSVRRSTRINKYIKGKK
jgi:hypothetical protein